MTRITEIFDNLQPQMDPAAPGQAQPAIAASPSVGDHGPETGGHRLAIGEQRDRGVLDAGAGEVADRDLVGALASGTGGRR